MDIFDASDKSEEEDVAEESFVEVHRVGTAQVEGSPPPQAKSINFEDVDDTNEGLVEMVGLTTYSFSIYG